MLRCADSLNRSRMTANGKPIVDEAPRVKLELYKKHSVCLVLDFGSQYTQLIARRDRKSVV